MGIFDKLKSTAQQAVNSAAQSLGNKRETFTFTSLPESLAEMQALPEASLDTPFKTAALTVLALCAYAADRNIGTEMLNWLRGPRPLNGQTTVSATERPICRSLISPVPHRTITTPLPSRTLSSSKATTFPVRSRVI